MLRPLHGTTQPLDALAVDRLGLPIALAMEAAGRAVAETLAQCCSDRNQRVVLLAGRGNNGGDAAVTARHLVGLGYKQLVLCCLGEPKGAEAQGALALLTHYPVEVHHNPDPELLATLLATAHTVVDGLLGCGQTSAPQAPMAAWVQQVIAWKQTDPGGRTVVAIDVPTGINSATGAVYLPACQADVTVSLATEKPGHWLLPAKAHCGQVVCRSVGWPPGFERLHAPSAWRITPEAAAQWLPQHPPMAHKYQVGTTLVLAGSPQFPGAATLVLQATLLAGAGMVYWASSLAATGAVPALPPEVVPLRLPDEQALSQLPERMKPPQAVAYGPGLGRTPKQAEALLTVLQLLQNHWPETRLVLDADGLNHLGELHYKGQLAFPLPTALGQRVVITPHLAEARRLVAPLSPELPPLTHATHLAQTLGCAVLLKSPILVYAHAPGEAAANSPWVSSWGTVALAKGGSGDVLTGLLTGVLAQTYQQPFAHGVGLAMALYGLAGQLAEHQQGPYSLCPSHVVKALPEAFQQLVQRTTRLPSQVAFHCR